MKIGDRQYEASVQSELYRSCEALSAIHAGNNAYVEWLREWSPESHAELLAFPGRIQALIGMVPIKVLAALIDCQVAAHRFWFECWVAHEAVGLEVWARLTASSGKVV